MNARSKKEKANGNRDDQNHHRNGRGPAKEIRKGQMSPHRNHHPDGIAHGRRTASDIGGKHQHQNKRDGIDLVTSRQMKHRRHHKQNGGHFIHQRRKEGGQCHQDAH